MAKEQHKCGKCGRTFKLAMHLARHRSAAHSTGKKKSAASKSAARKKSAKKRAARRVGRPALKRAVRAKKRGARRVGRPKGAVARPKGVVARLKLRAMGLDELAHVIEAARTEARRKMAAMRASIG